MSQNWKKYRQYLFSLLLLSYAFSALQVPLFEVLHFLSHSNDFSSPEYQLHSYSSHGENHRHVALDWFNEQDSDHEQQEAPTEQTTNKKKVEIADQKIKLPTLPQLNTIANFNTLFTLQSNYKTVLSPPPQVV